MTAGQQELPPIEITPAGATESQRDGVLRAVEESTGFAPVLNFIVDLIDRESMTTVIDFTPKAAAIRYLMDGVWHRGPVLDRESGDFMLATLKKIAGMNFRERRAKQEGEFTTFYQKVKQKVRVVSQGVPSGERVAIYLDWKRPPMETMDQLGMRSSMQKKLAEILNNPEGGMVLVGAVPGEGYTSAWRGTLALCDRLVRDFFVIEEVTEVEQEVINFYSVPFDRSKGETAMSPIIQLLLKQPDVLAFNELPDGETIDNVVQLSIDKKMPIYVRGPGKSTIDTLLRLLVLRPKAQAFIGRLDAIICMRVIRKLCGKCKIAYTPHPQMLQKLGLPAGRVGQFYQPHIFKPGTLDENEKEVRPCSQCAGIGFKGRTGLFELLDLDDVLKEAILANPRLDLLNAKVQDQGRATLLQEGIVLVAQGITSIDELQRLLKT